MTPDLPIFQIELECLGKVSSSEVVAMMEAAESRPGNDLQCLLCSFHARSACWSFLVQPEVCPVVMIVAEVFVHKALEMALVENDHVIEQVPAAVPDESLGHAVLPGTLKTGPLGLDVEVLDHFNNVHAKARAAVKDQILRRGVIGKCLTQLLDYPGTGWMFGGVEVQNPSPVVIHDKEAIQHAESERLHSKEVHRRDDLAMIGQECRPTLLWLRIPGSFSHPSQYRALGDLEAEHLEFTVNPWRSPGPILCHHAETASYCGK